MSSLLFNLKIELQSFLKLLVPNVVVLRNKIEVYILDLKLEHMDKRLDFRHENGAYKSTKDRFEGKANKRSSSKNESKACRSWKVVHESKACEGLVCKNENKACKSTRGRFENKIDRMSSLKNCRACKEEKKDIETKVHKLGGVK